MHAYGYGYTFKDYCIIALNQMSNMKILYVTQVGGEVIVAEGKKQCGGSSGVRKSKAKAAAPAPTKDPQSVVAKVLNTSAFYFLGITCSGVTNNTLFVIIVLVGSNY
jgi:hypothetical protein